MIKQHPHSDADALIETIEEAQAEQQALADSVHRTRRTPEFTRAKGSCRFCGEKKSERRSTAEFCSDKCRSDFANYKKTQGAMIVMQVKRWQAAPRGKARGRELTILERLARELVRQDAELGITHRPEAPLEFHSRVVVKPHMTGKKRERQGGVIHVGD